MSIVFVHEAMRPATTFDSWISSLGDVAFYFFSDPLVHRQDFLISNSRLGEYTFKRNQGLSDIGWHFLHDLLQRELRTNLCVSTFSTVCSNHKTHRQCELTNCRSKPRTGQTLHPFEDDKLLSAGESRRCRETSDRGHSGNFFCNVAQNPNLSPNRSRNMWQAQASQHQQEHPSQIILKRRHLVVKRCDCFC